ncbi:LOW QUALITY PROTEIN: FUT1-like protein [Mya arenaria]|uniref:L-Fucosyltransferase n=1 Tax=Mya arenaria TaxID=6604 RepID=A0ABY7GBX3_MYAAR|nr:LOW QUALITY PROTEIN: FUT1-like protein [Mya arenaria]
MAMKVITRTLNKGEFLKHMKVQVKKFTEHVHISNDWRCTIFKTIVVEEEERKRPTVEREVPQKLIAEEPYVLAVGTFVVAMYGTKVYIGKILGNDEDVRKLLQLPKHEDRIWIDRQNIICSVLEPSPTGKSRRMYKLSESDLKNIERGAGNVMFKIAALIGVAKRHGFLPRTTFDNHRIFKWFELPPIYYKFPATNSILVKEERHEYQTVVETLDTSRNWTLGGFRQSWRYFANARNEVRQMFTCCERLRTCQKRRHAPGGRHKTRESPNGSGVSQKTSLEIGLTTEQSTLIISDDIKWCKISTSGPDVFYSPFQTDVLDFALMVCCDHVIVTMGTFGWWGAWLSGGITVYYSAWPTKGSSLDRDLNTSDYFPDNWIMAKENLPI